MSQIILPNFLFFEGGGGCGNKFHMAIFVMDLKKPIA